MIYKRGGDTLVGLKAHVKVIEADELEAHLAEGWLDHPSKLFEARARARARARVTRAG